MTRRRGTAANTLFFTLFLAVQLAVPAVQLFAERPARFGWQMFSAMRPAPTFTMRLPSGKLVPAPQLPLAAQRIEMDLARIGVAHLCRTTIATAVLVNGREHPC